MSDRFTYEENLMDNCVTITDNNGELLTDFGTDIVIYPLEDSITLIEYMIKQDKVIKRLSQELSFFDYTEENIKEIIDEVMDE